MTPRMVEAVKLVYTDVCVRLHDAFRDNSDPDIAMSLACAVMAAYPETVQEIRREAGLADEMFRPSVSVGHSSD